MPIASAWIESDSCVAGETGRGGGIGEKSRRGGVEGRRVGSA
jgi:hypothetical protein